MCKGLASLPTTFLERAKGIKARLRRVLQTPNRSLPSYSHKKEKQRSNPEECLNYKLSFEKLLENKCGLSAFRAFLVAEFSEENIAFYLACEDFRRTKSTAKLSVKAKNIYDEFIASYAPREVNIDHETRNVTKSNLEQPTLSCFDLAQQKIFTLMEKDTYPRFMKSAAYQDLTNQLTNKSNKLLCCCRKMCS